MAQNFFKESFVGFEHRGKQISIRYLELSLTPDNKRGTHS